MRDIENLQLFMYTVDEYKSFSNCNSAEKTKDVIAGTNEKEYYYTFGKLMVLRKYTTKKKNNNVYLGNILVNLEDYCIDNKEEVQAIKKKLNEIEESEMQTVLSDGTELNLRETIEAELYGIYLHADKGKIEKVLKTDKGLLFVAIYQYVDSIEKILFYTYDLIEMSGIPKLFQQANQTASVLRVTNKGIKRSIEKSPHWKNIYGHDFTEKDLQSVLEEKDEESERIYFVGNAFLYELQKEDYKVKNLRRMIYPLTRFDWGDFSDAHDYICGIKNIGISNKVRYNDEHSIAYIYLFERVDEGFVIEEEQIVPGIYVMNLVKWHNKWRIYSIGSKLDNL